MGEELAKGKKAQTGGRCGSREGAKGQWSIGRNAETTGEGRCDWLFSFFFVSFFFFFSLALRLLAFLSSDGRFFSGLGFWGHLAYICLCLCL